MSVRALITIDLTVKKPLESSKNILFYSYFLDSIRENTDTFHKLHENPLKICFYIKLMLIKLFFKENLKQKYKIKYYF
jgi:hypothetical protein